MYYLDIRGFYKIRAVHIFFIGDCLKNHAIQCEWKLELAKINTHLISMCFKSFSNLHWSI